jgi:hypothetical protein
MPVQISGQNIVGFESATNGQILSVGDDIAWIYKNEHNKFVLQEHFIEWTGSTLNPYRWSAVTPDGFTYTGAVKNAAVGAGIKLQVGAAGAGSCATLIIGSVFSSTQLPKLKMDVIVPSALSYAYLFFTDSSYSVIHGLRVADDTGVKHAYASNKVAAGVRVDTDLGAVTDGVKFTLSSEVRNDTHLYGRLNSGSWVDCGVTDSDAVTFHFFASGTDAGQYLIISNLQIEADWS